MEHQHRPGDTSALINLLRFHRFDGEPPAWPSLASPPAGHRRSSAAMRGPICSHTSGAPANSS